MWYVTRTQPLKEEVAKKILESELSEVREVYIPYILSRDNAKKGDDDGHIMPALKGYLFVNVKGEVRNCLDDYGWFKCRYERFYPKTGKQVKVSMHLLNNSQTSDNLEDIIRNSTIPDKAMLDFRNSIDQIVSGIGDLRIEQESFRQLAKVNDVVVVLQGPMKGREGVVKRVSEEGGKRNRRFFIGFGTNLCISLSGVHQNDIAVVHEATESEEGKSVTLWRDIDIVEGALQTSGYNDDAPKRLRELVAEYNNDAHTNRPAGIDDKEWRKIVRRNLRLDSRRKEGLLRGVDANARISLKNLGVQFKSVSGNSKEALKEFIPDILIRPFLTPTSGPNIPGGKDYTILPHNGFTEYIIRKDLGSVFRHGCYEKDKYNPVFGEDYVYYAHVAVFNQPGCHRAVVSWGGFYDQYELLEEDSRMKFLDDLKKYKYGRLYGLLTAVPKDNGGSAIRFGRTNGIGGFYVDIDNDENELIVARGLADAVAPAAVEMWQGTRMREVWRRLLQRYVLLHKVPVRDMASVIPYNEKFDDIFSAKDENGHPDIPKIAESLRDLLPTFSQSLADGKPYEAVGMFLQTARGIAVHFVQDEHWNYLPEDGYTPDVVCTGMASVLLKTHFSADVLNYLWRGMVELQDTDSWRFFHLPSCLKQTRKFKAG